MRPGRGMKVRDKVAMIALDLHETLQKGGGVTNVLRSKVECWPTASRKEFVSAAAKIGVRPEVTIRIFDASRKRDARTYKMGLTPDGRLM